MTKIGIAALACGGCDPAEPRPAPPVIDPASAPALPTVEVPAALLSSEPPPWLAAPPPSQQAYAKGDRVWATVQAAGDLAQVGLYEVASTRGAKVDLTGTSGQRVLGVPVAYVHRLGEMRKWKQGEPVLFYAAPTGAALGRIAEVVAGSDFRARYDWAGQTREISLDHAERPRTGLVPLAVVDFPYRKRRSRGMIVAATKTQLWIRSGAGSVEVVERERCRPLALGKKLRLGQPVRAYQWASGIETGTLRRVLEPELRYEVSFGPNRAPRSYFFHSVFPPAS
ncbi:MAG: hypothetical protein AAGA56_09025 [Myxococcota bacterium]